MHNLSRVIQMLLENKVEFVLVGGFAAVAHGSPLGTQDVDICCPMTFENLSRLHEALKPVHLRFRERPDLAIDITPRFCDGLKNLYLKTDLCVLDCLGEIKGVGGYEEVSKHSTLIPLPSGDCPVIDIDTLIVAKKAMGRSRDLETVALLHQIKTRRQGS